MTTTKRKRRYAVSVTLECELECDDEVITRVHEASWKRQFYTFASDEQAVEMIAENLFKQRSLPSLDGWGDCSDVQARLRSEELVDWEVKRLP
jgi:hypothetical protein